MGLIRPRSCFRKKAWGLIEEVRWYIKEAVAVVAADTAWVRGRCTRQFAQNVKRNVKFLLNPETIVPYTAGIAIQSTRTKAVKIRF